MGMEVIAFDPFISTERAQQMQVRLTTLEALFPAGRLHHPAHSTHTRHRKSGERRSAAHDEKHGTDCELCAWWNC
jgi:hypothetical protein